MSDAGRREPSDLLLSLTDRGFRLQGPRSVEAVASGDGWTVELPLGTWDLAVEGSCLVLRDTRGEERARWTSAEGTEAGGVTGSILTADGRLFRIGLRGGREPAVELTGWEADGAYWSARPEAGGWALTRTPAGGELPDPDDALVVTFAAALADLRR